MRKIIGCLILLFVLVFSGMVFAYNDPGYPYDDMNCRSDGPSDDYGFRRNNCTSYAAFVLNLYGVPFNNRYKGVDWHDGNNWDNAADSAGISKSSDPLPGDIAQRDSLSNYGHVAFVEKVYYEANGYVEAIDVTEYNYNACVFGNRKLYADSSDYPDNFIHILAYNEAVTGMHYLDCYEMDSLCPNQTKDEWRGILQKVWNDYRCKNCSSNYSTAYVDTLAKAIGGMGGGPGTETLPTEPPTPLLPNFIEKKIWLETPWGAEVYKYGQPEIIKMKAQSKNTGEGTCTGSIEEHFYLSNGYKEDPHSGDGAWRRVGTDFIQCDNLKPGDTHTETEGLDITALGLAPGIYNIVACIDHTQDDHNNGGAFAEEHESDNCSTEAVFEVVAGGQINFPTHDFITSSFSFLQAPYYAGDQARFGGYVTNIGSATSPAGIRSNYSVKCNGGSLVQLTDDGTDASDLTPGKNNWEQNDDPVTMPNTSGSCIAYFCADYQGAVTETDEANNCSSFPFYLQPRPAPILSIIQFRDQRGCCTTNTGEYVYPDIWVRNTGSASPAQNVIVIYQISSPIGTGGAWWTIGYGVIEPRELPPGGTDEDYMDGSRWQIPKSNAWKYQWHAIRACLRSDGSYPTGDPNQGDICAAYGRYSKK